MFVKAGADQAGYFLPRGHAALGSNDLAGLDTLAMEAVTVKRLARPGERRVPATPRLAVPQPRKTRKSFSRAQPGGRRLVAGDAPPANHPIEVQEAVRPIDRAEPVIPRSRIRM